MSDIKVRVGQKNSVKIISSVSGGAAFSQNAEVAKNVIGGIASVSQINVSGLSTFVGLSTFKNDVYIDGNLYITSDITFDEFKSRNAVITGILTSNTVYTDNFYHKLYNDNGVAYFNPSGLMVSTGSTSTSINYTNYILTTNVVGIPTWSSALDGGDY